MKSREIAIGVVCLTVGSAGGFFLANSLNRQASTSIPSAIQPNTAAVDPATIPQGGMPGDVADTLEKAEADPTNFAAQMKAGDMYAQIGRMERAVEFYKRGILINPANFQANVVLANALFDSQKFEEAAGYYEKALQINPDDLNARTDLGATFVERPTPDLDRAIREFKTVRAKDPGHAPSLYYLAIATLRKGDRDGAAAMLREMEGLKNAAELTARLRQNIEAK